MGLLTRLASAALIAVVIAIPQQMAPAQTDQRRLRVLFLPILPSVLFLVYREFIVEVGALPGYFRIPW